jgi:hypothetical protein
MTQEFRQHPVSTNYEASSDGVVRNRRLKNPVGRDNGMGYLMFTVGKKKYYNHRFVFECFHGLIKDGFVIDHIDSNPKNNSLSNLQAITHSENTKRGGTGKYSKKARPVKSLNTITNEEKVFKSIYEAGKYFNICRPSVRYVAEGVCRSAISKGTGQKIRFSYV